MFKHSANYRNTKHLNAPPKAPESAPERHPKTFELKGTWKVCKKHESKSPQEKWIIFLSEGPPKVNPSKVNRSKAREGYYPKGSPYIPTEHRRLRSDLNSKREMNAERDDTQHLAHFGKRLVKQLKPKLEKKPNSALIQACDYKTWGRRRVSIHLLVRRRECVHFLCEFQFAGSLLGDSFCSTQMTKNRTTSTFNLSTDRPIKSPVNSADILFWCSYFCPDSALILLWFSQIFNYCTDSSCVP